MQVEHFLELSAQNMTDEWLAARWIVEHPIDDQPCGCPRA
jgi:hypothetical protein